MKRTSIRYIVQYYHKRLQVDGPVKTYHYATEEQARRHVERLTGDEEIAWIKLVKFVTTTEETVLHEARN